MFNCYCCTDTEFCRSALVIAMISNLYINQDFNIVTQAAQLTILHKNCQMHPQSI